MGKELKLSLHNGILIYIVYNNHNQYSYSIIYSQSKFDQKRFDNYDDRWDVSTRPHHFHMRGNNEVIDSPMNGYPEHDMGVLVDKII